VTIEDQVTQNARVEEAERVWAELSEREKGAALLGLSQHLRHRPDTVGFGAWVYAYAVGWKLASGREYTPPLSWEGVPDRELDYRLREIGAWAKTECELAPDMPRLGDSCFDLADHLERRRQRSREGRER